MRWFAIWLIADWRDVSPPLGADLAAAAARPRPVPLLCASLTWALLCMIGRSASTIVDKPSVAAQRTTWLGVAGLGYRV